MSKTVALLALLALSAAPSVAQNLTKGQEGRKAVGQCYSGCMVASTELDKMSHAQIGRIADLILEHPDAPQIAIETEQVVYCNIAVEAMNIMDACRAGCVDTEVAYGVRSSQARTRFMYKYNQAVATLRAAGLWTAYNRQPRNPAATCLAWWRSLAGGTVAETLAAMSASKQTAKE